MNYDPSKSHIPPEYNFTQPFIYEAPEEPPAADGKAAAAPAGQPAAPSTSSSSSEIAVLDVGPFVEFDPLISDPRPAYWRAPPPGPNSFSVPSSIAQRTRLTPLSVPEARAAATSESGNPFAALLSPFRSREELYTVEMELDYGKEWPRWVWQDGTFVFRPGFMGPWVDPAGPGYWLHRGIARFELSSVDRALQVVAGALYLAALAAAAAALYAVQPMLLAAVGVSWARNTLSVAKLAGLLALAAVDRVWLYWVFMVGGMVDRLLAKHTPGVRNFCWANLALWGLYLLVSPASWSPLPGVYV